MPSLITKLFALPLMKNNKYPIMLIYKKIDALQFRYENHQDKFKLIQSAILHASIGVVELFKCDINTKNYKSFCKKVSIICEKSSFKKEIKNFINHFDKYEKYLSFNKEFISKFNDKGDFSKFFSNYLQKKYKYPNEKIKDIKKLLLESIDSVESIEELYSCDDKSYGGFIAKVEKKFDKFHFPKMIQSLLDNEINISEEVVNVLNYKIFYNAQPAYSYLSNTKSPSVIARFNSPFFPNLLCGTSTLQEGLNLHLQCNKVYHFGSAHTMGDDEQRTGRIDRIHGKMYRELNCKKTDNPKLDIYYPYLQNTFDEENLRNMLCNKRSTEKKIDKCQAVSNNEQMSKIITTYECEKPISELVYNNKKNEDTSNESEPFGWEMKNWIV